VATSSKHRWARIIQIALSVVLIVAVFFFVIPKIASYSDVLSTVTSLTWLEATTLTAAAIFNLFTYWWQMCAAMPGLTVPQAAVNNQTTTTIANILPGGGAIALGITIAMLRSWGFGGGPIALLISTTGIWNSFMKLGLPIISLFLLQISGQGSKALLVPALVGLLILIVAVGLFALMLWRKGFARSIGNGVGAAWSWMRGLIRKPPVEGWGEGAVRFRKETIVLVEKRWVPLTVTTVISHLGLYLVLLLALRDVGVSQQEISWEQVLAVFAFARLLSAAPITPGGVGFVELALIGGLYAAGHAHADVPPDVFKAQITAATLLFRLLTYGIQIPLGAFTYVIWQRKKDWRRPPPVHDEPVLAGEAT
jgi:putative heme transporter